MAKKIRKMFFIDGFNLYHSIERVARTDIKFKDCKWLDLQSMCNKYIDKSKEELSKIKYFTAVSWKPTSRLKQQIYINALLQKCGTDIEIVYGKFKTKQRFCPTCQKEYEAHEEKLTDVNLAISLFENAMKNTFDEAVIVSADSDLIPPITAIKSLYADKCIAVLPPYTNPAADLKNNAHKSYKMKANTLLNSLLPNPCGAFNMPDRWKGNNYIYDNQVKKFIFQPNNKAPVQAELFNFKKP